MLEVNAEAFLNFNDVKYDRVYSLIASHRFNYDRLYALCLISNDTSGTAVQFRSTVNCE